MTDITPKFARGRHLVLAILALAAYLMITASGWASLEWLGFSERWNGRDLLARRSLDLLIVAVFAWLAFVGLDTRSKVEAIGSRWREAGWIALVLSGVFVVAQAIVAATAPADVLRGVGALYGRFAESGAIEWGWLIGFFAISALTEELLFRGLLQRALEGYVGPGCAVAAQALLFEWVHVLHGSALTGGFFFGGVVFGIAFTRTRNLALCFLLHLGGNVIHALLFATP